MRQQQISQSKLARQTGINQPSIHRILTSKLALPRQDTLRSLAEFFNITTDDLRYRDLSDQSLLPVNLRGFRIPFMNAREVGLDPTTTKKPPSRDTGTFVSFYPVSDGAVAFQVADRGMEPRINLDDVVVFDPALPAGPGQFVVARVDRLQEAVVRQLAGPDDRLVLRPINQQYPEIATNYKVLGRVVSRTERIA